MVMSFLGKGYSNIMFTSDSLPLNFASPLVLPHICTFSVRPSVVNPAESCPGSKEGETSGIASTALSPPPALMKDQDPEFGNIPFENASVLPGSESENILLCPSDRRGFGEVIVVPQAHSINAASFLSDRPR